MSNDPELIYLDILETILTATLDSQQWKPVLQKLSLLTGHQYATLLFYDKGNAQLISDLFLIDDKVFTDYRDVFLSIDPAEKILTGLPVGQMYRDREFLGDSFISKSTYYNEFHYPNNLNNVTSVKLCTANGSSTYLSLLTANDAVYPQPVQFEMFRRLIPALITASKLQARFEQLRDTIKYQSAVMDNGIYPVWLVDHAGKILYASAHAEKYQRANAWLIRSAGANTLSLDTDSKKLKQAIGKATQTDVTARSGLCYTSGPHVKPILVIPATGMPGVACIIIPEPFLTGSAFVELFNVKPAENAVAEMLVRGLTPDECARHLGVSITTIRTHLSSLYRKTHTRNQSELLLIIRATHG
ncbi:TPA: helix-turn-helix transcriptional regulator [Klebsiella pneumoniae]|uniref:helix-turn-helix transcriptional regulator n=1 Tax=Klebsiella quasipneumoniae TaxID=1463165 RepID=UPI001083F722|nr:helix-turn-helix transcriptional regulator [Klebsiella quasipneumoniae]HBR3485241.1 helix-turn-helix transcriptional regulator [Klebsiella pneumoniae]HCM7834067.1 helix-turn-helix transcriptional regulator [Klebsiella quasipneumoniae subsp. quasipneumoniae]HDH1863756.1 helix-turn-helix transcriptional regulator [Klebsiella quasipneumoniae subsp. similipneumoniae]MDZ2308175.1 helix-turn-helix transcriptional regulator [Klebsiella quasipneumoniae]VGH57770.1 LuxR family transcriptional regulat